MRIYKTYSVEVADTKNKSLVLRYIQFLNCVTSKMFPSNNSDVEIQVLKNKQSQSFSLHEFESLISPLAVFEKLEINVSVYDTDLQSYYLALFVKVSLGTGIVFISGSSEKDIDGYFLEFSNYAESWESNFKLDKAVNVNITSSHEEREYLNKESKKEHAWNKNQFIIQTVVSLFLSLLMFFLGKYYP